MYFDKEQIYEGKLNMLCFRVQTGDKTHLEHLFNHIKGFK